MESGLEDRNNAKLHLNSLYGKFGLNGVRPRRPEQSRASSLLRKMTGSLNGVRPRRPEQFGGNPQGLKALREERLNGVRPRRPEQ